MIKGNIGYLCELIVEGKKKPLKQNPNDINYEANLMDLIHWRTSEIKLTDCRKELQYLKLINNPLDTIYKRNKEKPQTTKTLLLTQKVKL